MAEVDGGIAAAKRAAAAAAITEIGDGMLIGLGTGSTMAFALAALGARVRDGLRVEAAATSLATAATARSLGIALLDFDTIAAVDLAIDGVDEIDDDLRAIKGGGGALLREKIVAAAAGRMIAIADDRKAVRRLGAAPLPIEVLPFAAAFVTARVESIGARAVRRTRPGGGEWRSDQGNLILDCRFPTIADPAALAASLAAIPGLLGHGLFLDEIDTLYIAGTAGVTRSDRAGMAPV